MALNPCQITSADLFSFLHAPKFFNKPFEFLLYKTNRLHFSACVFCNRSQKTSQRVKNNSHATRLRLVSYFGGRSSRRSSWGPLDVRVLFAKSRSQMTPQRVKNKKSTTRDEVKWRDCCSLNAVTASSVIYYSTHTRKNVIYFVSYNNTSIHW